MREEREQRGGGRSGDGSRAERVPSGFVGTASPSTRIVRRRRVRVGTRLLHEHDLIPFFRNRSRTRRVDNDQRIAAVIVVVVIVVVVVVVVASLDLRGRGL